MAAPGRKGRSNQKVWNFRVANPAEKGKRLAALVEPRRGEESGSNDFILEDDRAGLSLQTLLSKF